MEILFVSNLTISRKFRGAKWVILYQLLEWIYDYVVAVLRWSCAGDIVGVCAGIKKGIKFICKERKYNLSKMTIVHK